MSDSRSIEDFISTLPGDRRQAFQNLRSAIRDNLPPGFEERFSNRMLHYVVPLTTYPKGYHANPGQPLGLVSIASQKNFIAMYHMGLYGSKKLLDWFKAEYPKHSKSKLDMGKACVRFKKPGEIPFELIAGLSGKISPEDWIDLYEKALGK